MEVFIRQGGRERGWSGRREGGRYCGREVLR